MKNNADHIQEIKSPLAQTLIPRYSTGVWVLKTNLQLCLEGKPKAQHHLLETVIAMCHVDLGQLHGRLQRATESLAMKAHVPAFVSDSE